MVAALPSTWNAGWRRRQKQRDPPKGTRQGRKEGLEDEPNEKQREANLDGRKNGGVAEGIARASSLTQEGIHLGVMQSFTGGSLLPPNQCETFRWVHLQIPLFSEPSSVASYGSRYY